MTYVFDKEWTLKECQKKIILNQKNTFSVILAGYS